ncbi:MAG: glycoside hydrolase family 127 protein [Phycisphaerae bacterium]|nr:glycoside hydrolase family 127 protein [Phycisphaerae bacterium]
MRGSEDTKRPGTSSASSRRVLNPWRLEPVDLRRFIRLGAEHIYQGAIDRRRGCLPFVRFKITDPPAHCNHEYWGSPHMVGRFLDALALCSSFVSVPDDREAIDGLRNLLHGCLDNPIGLPFDTLPSPDGKKTAYMHHCREVLLALTGLWKWRKCERSRELARKLVRTIEQATRKTGSFPSQARHEEGWIKPEPNILNTTSGRLVGALVEYFHATRDDAAIDLAKRLADVNIAKTFTPDGELTDAAGTHLHSTEGTMTGLLYLGELTREKKYTEMGRALYDNGLAKWRTSWGWAKETRRHSPGRGEANNTGDFIESALVLAREYGAAYHADAERFVRNGLLASQIVETDWITQSNKADAADQVYSDIRRRARGAFAFTTPNGYHSYNTDLIGGALRALCKTCQATVMRGREHLSTHYVHLPFSHDIASVTVRSWLPRHGRLEIREGHGVVRVRLPEGADPSTVRMGPPGKLEAVKIPEPNPPGGIAGPDVRARRRVRPGIRDAVYLTLPYDHRRDWTPGPIHIEFDLLERRTREHAPGWKPLYEIDWTGNTITAMSPSEGPMALY